MHERHERPPVRAQDGHQRGRRDHASRCPCEDAVDAPHTRRASSAAASSRARARLAPSASTNAPSGRSPKAASWCRCAREPGATRSPCSWRSIASAPAWPGCRSLQSSVEPHVVGTPAERTGPVPGREGRHLVEEEELGELARAATSARAPSRGTPGGMRSSGACRTGGRCAPSRRACTRGCRRGARAPGGRRARRTA